MEALIVALIPIIAWGICGVIVGFLATELWKKL